VTVSDIGAPVVRWTHTIAALILMCAFAFGLCTIWIREAWPFVAFQGLLCMALLWLLGAAIRWPAILSYSPLLCLPFLIAVLGVLQLAFAHTASMWETRRAVLEWMTYAVAAFLTFQIFRDSPLRHRSVRIFALFAAGFAIVSVIQNYTSPGRVFWVFDSGFLSEVFGPFTSHSKFANFVELGVPCALWSAFHVRRRTRLVYVGAVAALVAAVVASASRAGVAIVLLELVILLVGTRERRRVRLALTIGVLFLVSSAILGWEGLLERLLNSEVARDTRWPIDVSSGAMARTFWLTGSGLGTWSTVYPQFATFDAYSEINQAHCDWLQWLIEGGAPLAAILLTMMGAAVRAATKEWWAWGFVFVWIHGLVDYPMQQTPAFAALQIAFWGAAVTVLWKDRASPA